MSFLLTFPVKKIFLVDVKLAKPEAVFAAVMCLYGLSVVNSVTC